MLEQVEDHPRDPGLNLLFILHIHGSLTRWLNDSRCARMHEKFQNRQKSDLKRFLGVIAQGLHIE